MSNFLPMPSGGQPPGPQAAEPSTDVEVVEEAPAAEQTEQMEALLAPESPSQRVTRHYSQRHLAEAIDQFESDLGGRKALIAILVGLPADDSLAATLGLLADPTSDGLPLHALCRAGGITLGDLYEATRKGVLVKPLLLALHKVAAKLGPIVDDLMERAAPHDAPCGACRGVGTSRGATPDSAPVPCHICGGTGVQRVLPELDRQKFALELARLVPKKGDQTVFMAPGSVANLGSGTVGSMTALLKETDRLPARPTTRLGTPRVIDVPSSPVIASPRDVAGDPTHPGPD